jgi:pimeloyl-ACP methyl ester esterase
MPALVTSGGVTINYHDYGAGTPLVFLHGWAMSGEVWHCQQMLAERYRCIAPDLRGHGGSSAPASGYSYDFFAHDLAELFSLFRLERAIVIAWSMGVQVALQAFPAIRERLAALVFVSGTARFTATDDYPFGLPLSESRGLEIRLKKDHGRAVREFVWGMFTDEERALLGHDYIAAMIDGHQLPAPHAAREALKSLASADFRHVLKCIDLPVLLVHGSADVICTAGAAQYMAGMLPAAELTVLEGAGHAPFLTRRDEFTGILNRFINGIHAED